MANLQERISDNIVFDYNVSQLIKMKEESKILSTQCLASCRRLENPVRHKDCLEVQKKDCALSLKSLLELAKTNGKIQCPGCKAQRNSQEYFYDISFSQILIDLPPVVYYSNYDAYQQVILYSNGTFQVPKAKNQSNIENWGHNAQLNYVQNIEEELQKIETKNFELVDQFAQKDIPEREIISQTFKQDLKQSLFKHFNLTTLETSNFLVQQCYSLEGQEQCFSKIMVLCRNTQKHLILDIVTINDLQPKFSAESKVFCDDKLNIFIIGGIYDYHCADGLSDTYRLSLQQFFNQQDTSPTQILATKLSKFIPRNSFSSIMVKQYIYVIGGFVKKKESEFKKIEDDLASCQRLDTTSPNPQWENMANLNNAKRAFTVCSYANLIYAFGGQQVRENEYGTRKLHAIENVENYNAESNVWALLFMKCPQIYQLQALPVAASKCIVIFGGYKNEQKTEANQDVFLLNLQNSSIEQVKNAKLPKKFDFYSDKYSYLALQTKEGGVTIRPLKAQYFYNPEYQSKARFLQITFSTKNEFIEAEY